MQEAGCAVSTDETRGERHCASSRYALVAVLLVGIALSAIKLTGPRDLLDNEQQRTGAMQS